MSDLSKKAMTATTISNSSVRVPHLPGEGAIWVFVFGDMTMFAVFFCQFLWDRQQQLDIFTQSARDLNVAFGAINTLLLLTASLLVVLGVQSAKNGVGKLASNLFAGAFVCGFFFGVNKFLEYGGKMADGHFPRSNDFFTYYYLYTGIHAVHLLIGMSFLMRMWRLSRQGRLGRKEIRFIEVGATYWHLVDLLWVVLFALLYLLG